MNNVKPLDVMEVGNDYYFFKKGIFPAWEDPVNAVGCTLTLSCPDRLAECVWMNTVYL